METKKIALSCFIGGAICVAIALLVAPYFWWLGLLAGFGAGYLGYEFKEVLLAVPIAWQTAKKEVLLAVPIAWQMVKKGAGITFKWWFGKPRPFFYLPVFLGTVCSYFLTQGFTLNSPLPVFWQVVILIALSSLLFVVVSLILTNAYLAYKDVTKQNEDVYDYDWETVTRQNEQFLEKHPEFKITYSNFFHWITKGLVTIVVGIPFIVTCLCIESIYKLLTFLARFVWNLFKLIHSDKRLLCGVDSALGGGITFWVIHSQPLPLATQLMAIFFGGVLGATFGVLNWELVSKRFLKVPASN